jgi:hypothetical protein
VARNNHRRPGCHRFANQIVNDVPTMLVEAGVWFVQ